MVLRLRASVRHHRGKSGVRLNGRAPITDVHGKRMAGDTSHDYTIGSSAAGGQVRSSITYPVERSVTTIRWSHVLVSTSRERMVRFCQLGASHQSSARWLSYTAPTHRHARSDKPRSENISTSRGRMKNPHPSSPPPPPPLGDRRWLDRNRPKNPILKKSTLSNQVTKDAKPI